MSQRERSASWRTRAMSASPRSITVRRFRLEVTGGPDRGLSASSDGDELSIGTAPGNQLQLTDPSVSRHHCAIAATERGFLVRDLDSTNGTLLGGFAVQAAYVEPGGILGLGASTLRFDLLEEEIRHAHRGRCHAGSWLLLGSR